MPAEVLRPGSSPDTWQTLQAMLQGYGLLVPYTARVSHSLDQHDAVGNALADEAAHDARQAVLQELHAQAGQALTQAVLTHTCRGQAKKDISLHSLHLTHSLHFSL